MKGSRLERLAAWVARRPVPVLGAVVLLALGAAALAAATLKPSSGADTLVGRSSDAWQASERYHERFGDDAVYVLLREDLTELVLGEDLQRVLGLEGCLSGNAPAGAEPPGGPDGPCGRLARTKPVQVVYGPGTFVNESVRQISEELSAQSAAKSREAERAAEAAYEVARRKGFSEARSKRYARQARELVGAEFTRDVLELALRYGLRSAPRLDDAAFVSTLVFEEGGTPKPRFAYLFPREDAALVQVRLKPGLDDEQRGEAIGLIRSAVAMAQWKLTGGGSYVVTGAPVVLNDLGDAISESLLVLLVAALLVMGATLALVFRVRLRLLPLAVALCAAALTFGGLALAGLPLTMASIGVLPVLIGLAVDYAIQFQSRTREEGSPVRAARLGGPTIVTAGTATAAGFLVLALSPVPMVRQFGLLLVAGIALALLCTLAAGVAALTLAGRRGVAASGPLGAIGSATRGAEELLAGNPVARRLRAGTARATAAVVALALGRWRRVLVAGLLLAAIGWALGTRTEVQSDVTKLVPQSLAALGDLEALQASTGVGGEIDVMVTADDLSDPAIITWMAEYQERLLRRYGYGDDRACGEATLCPAFSLPDLFRTDGGDVPEQADVRALLDAVPPYFSQAVITPDRRAATLAFGLRLMPLDEQQEVIETMRRELDPPEGVTAELAGLPVLAAEANAQVSSPWRRVALLLAGLAAVTVVLLAAFRSASRALVPLVPIVLATGWSALVLFALRVELNPMSVTLGALVVAISTEFSVLLAERYRQERAAGHAERAALERTYRSTGAAVLASATTAIAGFAVLVVSEIQMLRDFGWVTVVDLTVSLLGVLIVLPAVLVAADRGELRWPRLSRARPRPGEA